MPDAVTFAACSPLPALLGFVALAIPALLGREPSERTVARIGLLAAWAGLALALATAALAVSAPTHRAIGAWYVVGAEPFPLEILVDAGTAAFGLTGAVLLLVAIRFSSTYLHRDPGYTRFVALVLLFGVAVQVIAVAGGLDTLFFGWELAGLCSTLLVAFFHDRERPVRNALRLFVVYRVCDLGVLVAAVLLAHHAGTAAFTPLGHPTAPVPGGLATAVGLLLLLGAVGKAGQVPVSGWLTRAMEGPTPSSALFYGGLSLGAGALLLVRAWPWLEQAPVARAATVLVGLATALVGGLGARVAPDAKGALAWGSAAQLGLVFAEIGAGWVELALAHLVVHLLLRTRRLLRAPGAVHDPPRVPRAGLPRPVYALALNGFHLDAALDRLVAGPVLAVAAALDGLERRIERRLAGDEEGR